MPSTRHRQDIAAAALLAVLALGLYMYRAGEPPPTANEKPLNAAVDLLTVRRGYDDAGRFLPVFVRVSSELWLPPVPVYTTLAIAAVRRAEHPGRQAAVEADLLVAVMPALSQCAKIDEPIVDGLLDFVDTVANQENG